MPNPYSNTRTREGAAPGTAVSYGTGMHSAYAVPDIPETTDPDWTTAYATQLDPDYESGTTPDPIRTGEQPAPINTNDNRRYNARRTADFHQRHSVEETTVGWEVQQQAMPPGQNPLWTQDRPPTRPTATQSPDGYRFTRPWHIPRSVEWIDPDATRHVSMADHRRKYEIYGMRTMDRVGVNTFRADPQPWDQNLYPPDQHREVQAPYSGVHPSPSQRRWGL